MFPEDFPCSLCSRHLSQKSKLRVPGPEYPWKKQGKNTALEQLKHFHAHSTQAGFKWERSEEKYQKGAEAGEKESWLRALIPLPVLPPLK